MGRKGMPLAARFDPARQEALRAELSALVGGRLPPSVRALLVRELAGLLAACQRFLEPLDATGLLTRKGFLRVAYQREYLGRQDRLERLLELLGLDGDAAKTTPPPRSLADALAESAARLEAERKKS